jgi:hypothetical protein
MGMYSITPKVIQDAAITNQEDSNVSSNQSESESASARNFALDSQAILLIPPEVI